MDARRASRSSSSAATTGRSPSASRPRRRSTRRSKAVTPRLRVAVSAASPALEQLARSPAPRGRRTPRSAARASVMIPISRRTIRSAIVRCSRRRERLEVDALRQLALGRAHPHPLREQVHEQRRRPVHVVDRVLGLVAGEQQQRSQQHLQRPPTPAPRAARTRSRPTAGPSSQATAPQTPATRFSASTATPTTRWTSATRPAPATGDARLRRKALCNTLLQEWCITRADSRIERLYRRPRPLLKSYLPVLVFLGLGSAVGIAFTTLNRVLGPSRPNKTKSRALRVRPAVRRAARLPLRDQLLPGRDAVHPLRRRGRSSSTRSPCT